MRIHTHILALATLLVMPAFAAAQEQPHAIKLQRSLKPGAVYDAHFTLDESIDSSAAAMSHDPRYKSTSVKLDLTGRISDAQSDAAGNTQQFTLSIKHLTKDGRDCIRPGSVLTVEYDYVEKKIRFVSQDRFPVPDNAKPLLLRFFPENHSTGTTLDKVMGSENPRKTGETWKINPDAAADFFSEEIITLAPFDLSGVVTLAAAAEKDGVATLQITSKIDATDFTTSYLPKTLMMEESNLVLAVDLLLPEDPAQPALQFKESVDATCKLSTVSSLIKGDLKIHGALVQNLTPVRPATAEAASAAPAK